MTSNNTSIEFSAKQIRTNVINNIFTMIYNRGLLRFESKEAQLKKWLEAPFETNTFEIKLDKKDYDNIDVYHISLKLDVSISKIARQTEIDENPKIHQIIILHDIANHFLNAIMTKLPLIEIFLVQEMIIDIASCDFVPKHILLSVEEKEKILNESITSQAEIPKIFITDPMSKYFNAKVGQIFRILRPSETSVYSVYYRLVIKNNDSNKK